MDKATILVLTGGLVALLGVWMIVASRRTQKVERDAIAAAATWPKMLGRVTGCGVATRGGRKTQFFEPVIEYEYRVEGRDYHGNRLWIGRPMFTFHHAAKRAIEPYQVNKSVPVLVDPANPKNSVLELKGTRFNRLAEFLGGLVLLGGLVVIVAFSIGGVEP